MKAPGILLKAVGIGILVYAASFIYNPLLLAEMVGFKHHSPNTLVEITAFYGGLELGLGLFFIWASLQPERHYLGLMCFVFAFLTASILRVFGILVYGFDDLSQPVVAAIEILVSLYAYVLTKKLNPKKK
jgi:hypothetical protein